MKSAEPVLTFPTEAGHVYLLTAAGESARKLGPLSLPANNAPKHLTAGSRRWLGKPKTCVMNPAKQGTCGNTFPPQELTLHQSVTIKAMVSPRFRASVASLPGLGKQKPSRSHALRGNVLPATLCVARIDAERREKWVPTQSVGTRNPAMMLQTRFRRHFPPVEY